MRLASVALPGPLKVPVAAASSIATGTGLAINATAASGLAVYGTVLNMIDDLIHLMKFKNGQKSGWQRDLLTNKRSFATEIDRTIKSLARLSPSQLQRIYVEWNRDERKRVVLYQMEGSWKNGNQIAVIASAFLMALTSKLAMVDLGLEPEQAVADVKAFSKGCLTNEWLAEHTPVLNSWIVRVLSPREEGVVAW